MCCGLVGIVIAPSIGTAYEITRIYGLSKRIVEFKTVLIGFGLTPPHNIFSEEIELQHFAGFVWKRGGFGIFFNELPDLPKSLMGVRSELNIGFQPVFKIPVPTDAQIGRFADAGEFALA